MTLMDDLKRAHQRSQQMVTSIVGKTVREAKYYEPRVIIRFTDDTELILEASEWFANVELKEAQ